MRQQNPGPVLEYRTASACNNGGCIEVAHAGDGVALRDSKDRGKPPLMISIEDWRVFLAEIRSGVYDRT